MYAKLIVALCALGVARAGGLYGAAPLAYSGHAIAAPAVYTKTISPAVSSVSSYSTHTAHGGHIASYAAAPIVAKTYAAAPAVAAYSAAPAVAYSAAPAVAYSAAPVVTKTITPAVSSISSYSTQTAHGNLYAAAPAVAAYSAPVVAKSYVAPAVTTYAAAPVVAKTYAAPAVATYAAAPVVTKTITPAVSSVSSYSSTTAHGSPVVAKSYVAAPAVATYAAAPAISYGAHGYSAVAAPLVTKTVAPAYTSYAAAAPAYASYAAAPAYASYAAAAPVLKSAVTYSAAPAVSHISYSAHGANYGWILIGYVTLGITLVNAKAVAKGLAQDYNGLPAPYYPISASGFDQNSFAAQQYQQASAGQPPPGYYDVRYTDPYAQLGKSFGIPGYSNQQGNIPPYPVPVAYSGVPTENGGEAKFYGRLWPKQSVNPGGTAIPATAGSIPVYYSSTPSPISYQLPNNYGSTPFANSQYPVTTPSPQSQSPLIPVPVKVDSRNSFQPDLTNYPSAPGHGVPVPGSAPNPYLPNYYQQSTPSSYLSNYYQQTTPAPYFANYNQQPNPAYPNNYYQPSPTPYSANYQQPSQSPYQSNYYQQPTAAPYQGNYQQDPFSGYYQPPTAFPYGGYQSTPAPYLDPYQQAIQGYLNNYQSTPAPFLANNQHYNAPIADSQQHFLPQPTNPPNTLPPIIPDAKSTAPTKTHSVTIVPTSTPAPETDSITEKTVVPTAPTPTPTTPKPVILKTEYSGSVSPQYNHKPTPVSYTPKPFSYKANPYLHNSLGHPFSYANSPVNTAEGFSPSTAVSHVSYKGLGTNYSY